MFGTARAPHGRVWPLLVAQLVLPASLQLSDADAARVVGAHLRAVKTCWAIERRDGGEGGGKAILSLEIAPSGLVREARVDAAFASPNFRACLRARAASWTFPRSARSARFTVPLVFVGP
jgi:hypothetical protein